MKVVATADVLIALDEHRENYDSDCSWHRGCSCGWVPAPTARTEWFDDDVGHPAWLAHMAEVITDQWLVDLATSDGDALGRDES